MEGLLCDFLSSFENAYPTLLDPFSCYDLVALSIIGAHGLTDMIIGFYDPFMWGTYAIYFFVISQLSEGVYMTLFLFHSLFHFSVDMGWINAFYVSTLIPIKLVFLNMIPMAIYFEISYLLIIHVPFHYIRVYDEIAQSPLLFILPLGHIVIYFTISKFIKNLDSLLNLEECQKKALVSMVCSHVFYNYFRNY